MYAVFQDQTFITAVDNLIESKYAADSKYHSYKIELPDGVEPEECDYILTDDEKMYIVPKKWVLLRQYEALRFIFENSLAYEYKIHKATFLQRLKFLFTHRI